MINKKYEKEYHDKYVSTNELRGFESKFYAAVARDKEDELIFNFLGGLYNKKVLFYGSGGHFSLLKKLHQKGAHVTAIDISPNTVKMMNDAIDTEGLSSEAEAIVMDCESLDFKAASFDVVLARSIIHHLNVEVAMEEIQRVLKKGGSFVAVEPLGTNWLINLYRWFTPMSRTLDEHPFKKKDIDNILRHFPGSRMHYFYCSAILAYFQRMISGDRYFDKLFCTLHWIDQKIFLKLPLMRFMFWDIIVLSQKNG